jgi:hypothetical protein
MRTDSRVVSKNATSSLPQMSENKALLVNSRVRLSTQGRVHLYGTLTIGF